MLNNLRIRHLLVLSLSMIGGSLVVLTVIFWLLSGGLHDKEEAQQTTSNAMMALKEARFNTIQIQQFLTDVAATGDDGGYVEAADHLKLAKENLDRFILLAPEFSAFADSAKNDLEALHNTGVKMAHAYVENGRDAGNALMKAPNNGLDALSERLSNSFNKMVDEKNQALEAKHAILNAAIQNAQLVIAGLAFGCAVIAALMMWLLDSKLVVPLRNVSSMMVKIGRDSDLTQRIPTNGNNGVSDIANEFNSMLSNFRQIVEQVMSASAQLASAAGEVSSVTMQTTSNVRRQQGEIDQVATAMNEMAATVQEVARNAEQAARAAKDADQSAKNGALIASEAMGGIDALVSAIEKSATVIRELEAESKNIGAVLDVIKGIAEQTNLLALNAAIEAARAGEQGRGFAVVADEVRTLASRTQKSTQEIHTIIERLQSGASNAVKAMEQARNQGNTGVEQVERTAESLAEISGAVATINAMNTQIASAAEEQSAVAEEVNRNVVNISQGSAKNAQSSEQTAFASQSLARLATDLQGLVARFRV